MRENSNNNTMESLYEENGQYAPATTSSVTSNSTTTSGGAMKRPLTLDFNKKSAKRRFNQSLQVVAPAVLNSPDLNKLGLASPDLEKFIMSNNSIQTPTPGIFNTKVNPFFDAAPHQQATKVSDLQATTEQEAFTEGFVKALNQLHNENSSKVINTNTTVVTTNTVTNTMSGGEITSYTNLDSPLPIAIKDEPQTVPQSPPMSPIDMEDQERIKLERKRMRNRVAASKCRKRKLERISKLEDKVKILKGENAELSGVIHSLKSHVFKLKQQVIEHVKSGCTIHLNGQF